MNISHQRNLAPPGAETLDNDAQILRIFQGRRRQANQLAAGLFELENLAHAVIRIPGLAGQHRLNHDWLICSDNDAALSGNTHHHLAGGPALVKVK